MPTYRDAGTRQWLKHALVSAALVVCLLASCGAVYAQDSDATPDSSLTEAEVRSLYDLLSDQDVRIQVLEIDLRTTGELAAVDSTIAARRLAIVSESYEAIIEGYKKSRPSFLERLVKQPVVWLALGTWFGAQATR